MQHDDFSPELIKNSHLRRVIPMTADYLGDITQSHGGLILFETNSCLIDLRSYSYKPFIGHTHPLLLKFGKELLQELSRFDQHNRNLDFIIIDPTSQKRIFIEQSFILEHKVLLLNTFYTQYDFYDQLKYHDFVKENLFINFQFNNTEYILSISQLVQSDFLKMIYQYLSVIVHDGKMVKSQMGVLKSRIENSKVLQDGLLLKLQNNNFTLNDFYKVGLYVNDNNLKNDTWFLFVPHCLTHNQLDYFINALNNLIGE